MSLHVVQSSPVHVDDFGRANSTNLGLYWTETGGDLGIVSNLLAVQGTLSSRRAGIYVDPTFTPFQTVQFTVGTTPNTTAGSGAVLRCNAAMNQMVILSVASNGWNLGRITGINGTFTSIASQAVTISVGTVIRVSVDHDSVWRVYVNGGKSGPSARDTTWADNDHRYAGLFVQRASFTNSASLGGFRALDTPHLTLVDSDDFSGPALTGWTLQDGPLYLDGGELSGVGTPSEPLSYAFRDTPISSGYTKVQVARARVRWNGRNPLHSAAAVGVRADRGSGHNGVCFWFTADKIGIAWFDPSHTDGFLPATGTDPYVSTSKFPENALVEIRAEDTVFTASVDGVPVLQGTFTTTQVPLTNRTPVLMIQDDSAEVGGGEPPANLDDYAALVA